MDPVNLIKIEVKTAFCTACAEQNQYIILRMFMQQKTYVYLQQSGILLVGRDQELVTNQCHR